MNTEMGEYLVGAYLKQIEKCDVVDYNVRPPGGGLPGLSEFDVIGIKFHDKVAFMCEVTTHLHGLNSGTSTIDTIEKVCRKFKKQRQYAKQYFQGFKVITYMFWSPYVPKGRLLNQLKEIEGLELVVNGDYKAAVEELRQKARKEKQATQNPAFRLLQILESVRD